MKKIHESLLKKYSWYENWHDSKIHTSTHWGIFVLTALIVTSNIFLSTVTQNQTASVLLSMENESSIGSEIPELNKRIITLAKEIRKTSSEEEKNTLLKELKAITEERLSIVKKTIEKNPNQVIRNSLNRATLAKMPPEIMNMIEEKKQIKGKFEHIHIHYGDFDNGRIEDIFYITESGTKKKYRIHVEGNNFNALTDDEVKVDGIAFGDQLATETDSLIVLNAATPVNSRKVAAILINYPTKSLTFNATTVRETIFDTSDNYFKENSFDKWGLVGKNTEDGNGDVFGPYTIAYDGTNCITSTIGTEAKAAAASAGVDLSGYTNIIYFFPSSPCMFSGVATVGGNPGYVYMNGNTNLGTVTHELGHNMGARHAGAWDCTENGIPVSIGSVDTNCVVDEYGDPYSVMGNSGAMRHFNNYHKGSSHSFLNWLKPENTYTVDRNTSPDSIYTVVPIETSATGIQSLRIPRTMSGTTTTDYYYIEFRQPIGFDYNIHSYTTKGVTIRVAPGYGQIANTKLIDTTPETYTPYDAPLAVGKTFTDSSKNITITTLSADSTGAQVRVSFGPLSCSEVAPIISISPTQQTSTTGGALNFNFSIKNNSSYTCPPATYSISSKLPSNLLISPSTISDEIVNPGLNITRTVSIVPIDSTPNGNYFFSLTANNISNTLLKSTATSTYILNLSTTPPPPPPPPPPTTVAPTVSITSPLNGAKISSKGNTTISATATDDIGVKKVEFYIDGKLMSTKTKTPYTYGWNTGKVTIGTHTIQAKAYDTDNNVGTSTIINVTK